MAETQPIKAPRCDEHPPMPALYRCDVCRKYVCRLCVKKGADGSDICVKCGATCRAATPEQLGFELKRQTQFLRRGSSTQAPLPRAGEQGPGTLGAPFPSAQRPPLPSSPGAEAPQQAAAQPETRGPKPPIPFSERKPPFFCKNHPQLKATRLCERCKEFYCNACAKMVEDNPLCPDCSAQITALMPEDQGFPPRGFGDQLGEALAFPFKGSGKLMLVLGAIFCWLLSFAGGRGIALSVGFMYLYYAKVCRASAVGREAPPDWPGLDDLRSAVYFFVAKLLSLAPVVLYIIAVVGLSFFTAWSESSAADDMPETEEDATWRQLAEDKDMPPGFQQAAKDMVRARRPPKPSLGMGPATILGHILVVVLLYLAGTLYLPMALLALLLYRSYQALNPIFVLGSISRVPRDYLLVYLVMMLTDVIAIGMDLVVGAIPLVGALISSTIWIYLMMSQMHILGRLYHFNQKRLGWFNAASA